MPEPDKHAAAQQAVDILHEISTILNCHLDRRTLSICISMIERGVNPEALAVRNRTLLVYELKEFIMCVSMQQVIKELRQEAQQPAAAARRR
ncbi:hypothetical protein QWA68_002185 [Fusarium oxysporum]|nr:hypothetical protein QWA68_002185 [Fusarium oxysporum]